MESRTPAQTAGGGQAWPIRTLLVPQGAEYRAVCRGLRAAGGQGVALPQVIPIPIGIEPVTRRLGPLNLERGGCLLLGLGGGLDPALRVGDGVLGQSCWVVNTGTVAAVLPPPSPSLITWMQPRLPKSLRLGRVVTSDRLLSTPAAKQALHRLTEADVVDMESSAVLAALAPRPVAILRVISDGWDQALPDLTPALTAEGHLHPWPLAWSLIRQPRAATHLIRGARLGLQRLQALTRQLFLPVPPT
ncbi:MAG TPA: phosphorylase [Leptolyngbyaceae cyanobacterium M65_K2018_010]|nr:phosphorylase [Leptolyngbyaceae cyanobacterium M65_K2018_010]